MISIEREYIPELVLTTLVSYLDAPTLISARLVYRKWNPLALSFFPRKVCISTKQLAGQRTSEGIEMIKNFNPDVFCCIRDYDEDEDEQWRKDNKFFLLKFLSCMKHIGANNNNITYIIFCGAAELESLVTIVNFQGLPNLTTIESNYVPDPEYHKFTSEFLPGSLPSLKNLTQCLSPSPDYAAATKLFVQSLIDASLNLEELSVNFYYDLRQLKRLKRLRFCCPEDDPALFGAMLAGVANTLESLILFDFPVGTKYTRLPNLQTLETINLTRKNNPFLDIASIAPNLEVLKTLCLEGDDPSVAQYLLSKPTSLEELQVGCCPDPLIPDEQSWCEKVCSKLDSYPPNLNFLRVIAICQFGSNPFQQEVLQFVLNLNFPHLIIDGRHEITCDCKWFSNFIRAVKGVELNINEERKQSLLEICLRKQSRQIEELEEDVLQYFTIAMQKLSLRWDCVRLKHLTILPSQMDILQREVFANQLPVEFFYNFGQ